MEYEQKYKEALERAKDMMSYKEVRREDMEYIFPELKESKDEEIKRWIINSIKIHYHNYDEYTEFVDAAIAWLEKQKPVEWSKKDEKMANRILEVFSYDQKHYLDETEWIKSLKQRITKQD